jgi:ankyrin repeat protein
LIDSGADPNQALSNTGETPLHSALSKANRPHHDFVVEILLAGGADPNVATKPDKATGAFMRDCRTKAESPLHRAAAFGSESSIRMLLDAGGLRDARDMNGDSPLSWASWHLRPSPILRMLSYGKHLIHKDHNASYDHGRGWEQQRGKPHT